MRATVEYGAAVEAHADAIMRRLFTLSDQFTEWLFCYPGFVTLHTQSGAMWTIGTANGTWGADYFKTEEAFHAGDSPNATADTNLSWTFLDTDRIADELFRAMTEVQCGHCGGNKPVGQSCGCFDNGGQ